MTASRATTAQYLSDHGVNLSRVMIEEAISYPFEGDDAITALLFGSMLIFASTALFGLGFVLLIVFVGVLLFPVAMAISLPVGGYYVDVLRTTVEGQDEPPVFDDWGKLFVDGLKAAIIGTIYAIVPTILFFVVGFGLVSAGTAAGDTGGGILGGLGILVFLLAIPFYFVVGYVTPAALTNFAVQNSLGAAFDFSLIFDVVTDRDYVVAAVFAVVIGGVAGSVATMLYSILIGFIVSPVILFYAYVVSYRLFGKAYVQATDGASTAGRQQSV